MVVKRKAIGLTPVVYQRLVAVKLPGEKSFDAVVSRLLDQTQGKPVQPVAEVVVSE